MMRMKDSDDYITARAANPRTGVISPSVGTPTPGSPGEALRLGLRAERKKGGEGDGSPGCGKGRPALRRANEGRKVSAGAGLGTWTAAGCVASPRVTTLEAGADLLSSSSSSSSSKRKNGDDLAGGGDRFVIPMPSAREPQPYAFPGYSAQQIAAFEHYKENARKVSGEGYDPRVLQARRRPSDDGMVRQVRDVRAFSGERAGAAAPNRDVLVLKRRARKIQHEEGEDGEACAAGAELKAANFAPFSSPRTPSLRSGTSTATTLTTFASAHIGRDNDRVHKPIARKLVSREAAIADLRRLPQVSLVHPAVAAIPRNRQPVHGEEVRKCSLGCVQDATQGVCLASLAGTGQRVPLFPDSCRREPCSEENEAHHAPLLHALYTLTDALIATLLFLFDVSKAIPFPRVRVPVLETLLSEHATPEEKVAAVKAVVGATGQAVGVLTVLVLLWNLAGLVVRVVEVVFWPVMLPVRVARWIVVRG